MAIHFFFKLLLLSLLLVYSLDIFVVKLVSPVEVLFLQASIIKFKPSWLEHLEWIHEACYWLYPLSILLCDDHPGLS